MIENLNKITKIKPFCTPAIEAIDKPANSKEDYQLIGVENLAGINETLDTALRLKEITHEKNSFINVIGTDEYFFYVIQRVVGNVVDGYEKGIASIYTSDDKIFLKRHCAFLFGYDSSNFYMPPNMKPHEFNCRESNARVYAFSSHPNNLQESLFMKNSIITNVQNGVPSPIQIQEDSLVGRLEENVESLSFKDKRLIDKISESLQSFTKQLKLKTSKLTTNRAEFELLDIKPSKNPKAKRGSIYYDEKTDLLKYYDGKKWRTLMFKEEE